MKPIEVPEQVVIGTAPLLVAPAYSAEILYPEGTAGVAVYSLDTTFDPTAFLKVLPLPDSFTSSPVLAVSLSVCREMLPPTSSIARLTTSHRSTT